MALSHGANKSFALERLLTALRRVVLLELAHERFEDKTLQAFTLALVTQCLANEHVWAETSEESDRVALLLAGRPSLKPDDFEVSRSVLLPALYRPLSVVLPAGLKDPAFETLRPRALRDLIKARLETEAAESEAAARFTSGSRAGDAITQRVIGQYEGSPYPRFSSLTLPRPGSLLPFLKRIFTPDPISFVDGDFDVLIAGCGTGRHAIQSALGYGPRANVRAIDLSARSLAFAGAVAKRFGVGNLTFERADLLALDPKARAFDVIEAVGVLHHLADPFAGWLTLLACLKPHGLMLLGLYSAASRKVLGALRVEPEFPGAGCTDQAARAYRQLLLARGPEQPGGDLVISKDAYTLSEFRDLALHEHEKPISLPEIAAFLTKHKLVFQGFLLPGETLATFRKRFPEAGAERDLARWATYETDNPRLFDGMYRFWCRRG